MLETECKESKLAIIEQRLNNLYSAVEKLESLSDKIIGKGEPKPTPEDMGQKVPLKPLSAWLTELPAQLDVLSGRISKSVETISSAIY